MKSFEYAIKDELGIHARPAGLLAKLAMKYPCKITMKAPKKEVDAKRVMAVMSAGVKNSDSVTLEFDGENESEAYDEMLAFFTENL